MSRAVWCDKWGKFSLGVSLDVFRNRNRNLRRGTRDAIHGRGVSGA